MNGESGPRGTADSTVGGPVGDPGVAVVSSMQEQPQPGRERKAGAAGVWSANTLARVYAWGRPKPHVGLIRGIEKSKEGRPVPTPRPVLSALPSAAAPVSVTASASANSRGLAAVVTDDGAAHLFGLHVQQQRGGGECAAADWIGD